jgi:large subunit ribosomal protein L21
MNQYAVVKTGGKQFRVAPGDTFRAERLDGEVGATVALEEVLAVRDETTLHVGQPLLNGARVLCVLTDQTRAPKILIHKYRRRKGYHLSKGHRQSETWLKVTEIRYPS